MALLPFDESIAIHIFLVKEEAEEFSLRKRSSRAGLLRSAEER